jgi:predicted ATP-dependent serine protease
MKPFREAKVTSTSRLPLARGRPKVGAGDAGNKAWLKREGTIGQNLVPMKSVSTEANKDRLALFSKEANRVLGGGLVKGSIVLLAGEPGVLS